MVFAQLVKKNALKSHKNNVKTENNFIFKYLLYLCDFFLKKNTHRTRRFHSFTRGVGKKM